MPEPQYVVGMDGGNSKTDVVVADCTGRVLGSATVDGTRAHHDGLDHTAESLLRGVRHALTVAGLPATTTISAAVCCLANVDVAAEEDAMRVALERRGLADQVHVHNDVYAVLRAGAAAGWGVAVVVGAGINALGRHPDGRLHRFLALGAETGDWGGGGSVGMAGLGAAVRAGDGRGLPTTLRDLLPPVAGRPDVETIAYHVHTGELDRYLAVLPFAPVVLAAAADGDSVSIEIVDHLATETAGFATAALNGLGMIGMNAEIVLGGGILQSGHRHLVDAVHRRIGETDPSARVTVLDVAPVAGALVDALSAVGADDHALGLARSQLRR